MSTPLKSLEEYRRLCESFRIECPAEFNFGYDVIDRHARERPKHLALHWVGENGQQQLTYAEMAARSSRVAAALIQLGLRRGDRVLVVLPSVVPWWESMLGVMKAGLVAIPGTTLLTAKDIAYRIESAEATAVITDASGAEKVEQIVGMSPGLKHKLFVGTGAPQGWQRYEPLLAAAPADLPPIETRSDEPALIYFTSGTTGLPKMVLHTHASYGVGHRLTARFWLGLGPEDLHWNISDTGWAKTAWSGLFGPWIAGATLFVRHLVGKFDPGHVIETLQQYPITSLCAPPTVYRMLVQHDLSAFHPAALRRCMAAGEPLNPAIFRQWKDATGLAIREGYGQTETVLLCSSIPDLEVRPGSMGLPPPGMDVAVIDERGYRCPAGVEGDIAVRVEPERPVGLYQEYWHNAEATAKSYRDGWYLTGDCASRDEDGYFWFTGRADDIITSAAYRIGPFEVESALIEHPAVVEAGVVGKPDPMRGEIVKAYVVLAAEYRPSDSLTVELQEHVKRTTAPYKYPREIEYLDALPKTTSGKIRHVELRHRAAAEAAAVAATS